MKMRRTTYHVQQLSPYTAPKAMKVRSVYRREDSGDSDDDYDRSYGDYDGYDDDDDDDSDGRLMSEWAWQTQEIIRIEDDGRNEDRWRDRDRDGRREREREWQYDDRASVRYPRYPDGTTYDDFKLHEETTRTHQPSRSRARSPSSYIRPHSHSRSRFRYRSISRSRNASPYSRNLLQYTTRRDSDRQLSSASSISLSPSRYWREREQQRGQSSSSRFGFRDLAAKSLDNLKHRPSKRTLATAGALAAVGALVYLNRKANNKHNNGRKASSGFSRSSSGRYKRKAPIPRLYSSTSLSSTSSDMSISRSHPNYHTIKWLRRHNAFHDAARERKIRNSEWVESDSEYEREVKMRKLREDALKRNVVRVFENGDTKGTEIKIGRGGLGSAGLTMPACPTPPPVGSLMGGVGGAESGVDSGVESSRVEMEREVEEDRGRRVRRENYRREQTPGPANRERDRVREREYKRAELDTSRNVSPSELPSDSAARHPATPTTTTTTAQTQSDRRDRDRDRDCPSERSHPLNLSSTTATNTQPEPPSPNPNLSISSLSTTSLSPNKSVRWTRSGTPGPIRRGVSRAVAREAQREEARMRVEREEREERLTRERADGKDGMFRVWRGRGVEIKEGDETGQEERIPEVPRPLRVGRDRERDRDRGREHEREREREREHERERERPPRTDPRSTTQRDSRPAQRPTNPPARSRTTSPYGVPTPSEFHEPPRPIVPTINVTPPSEESERGRRSR